MTQIIEHFQKTLEACEISFTSQTWYVCAITSVCLEPGSLPLCRLPPTHSSQYSQWEWQTVATLLS